MRVTNAAPQEVPGAIDDPERASSPPGSESLPNQADGVDPPGRAVHHLDADRRPTVRDEVPRAVACRIDHDLGLSRPVSPQTTQKDVDDLGDAAGTGDVAWVK